MPIDFACPYCGHRTNVANRFAGLSGPCISCGQTITVPEASESTSGMSPAPIPPKDPTDTGPAKSIGFFTVALPLLLIAILLAALLIPAVQASREAARRTQCNNNLRSITLGLQNYHDTYKTFPSGAWHAGIAGQSERLGPSWWYASIPFFESGSLYDRVQSLQRPEAPGNGAFNAENINAHIPRSLARYQPDYMRCPSSPLPLMETPTGPILLPTYVGISGGCDLMSYSPDYAGLPRHLAPTVDMDYVNRRKGMGHTTGAIITVNGMLPACEQVRMASCIDGTANTMIVGEQADWLLDVDPGVATKYHGDAGWDTSGTGPSQPSLTSGGGFISGTYQSYRVPAAVDGKPGKSPAPFDCYNLTTVRYPANSKHVMGQNAWPGCDEDHGINNPLQSPHPGGLLAAFTDGSVHYISETADLSLLLRLASRDDCQVVNLD